MALPKDLGKRIRRGPNRMTPTCHPDRRYKGNGLCAACYIAALRAADPEGARAKKRAWRKQNPDKTRASSIRCSFGPNAVETYDQLYALQRGLCGICFKPCKYDSPRLSIDHDHETGHIRGLLCRSCNLRLGHLEDREWRHAAEAYLAKHTQPAAA